MISPDQIIDRIKLKRQIVKWRLVAIFGLCMLAIVIFVPEDFDRKAPIIDSDYIARIEVNGMILNDNDRIGILRSIASDKYIKAVILHINSPGGTVVGGETLYNAIRKISEAKKPVVSVMGDLAASAGYMTALGSDYLIAHQGTITGSIGVLAQTFEISEFANRNGIKFKNFKSSPLKGGPLPTEPLSPEMIEALDETIQDMYDMFFNIVVERRPGIPRDKLVLLADGRAYTGRQALANGLIDAIGDEDTAQNWLRDVKAIDASLKVRDIDLQPQPSRWRKILDGASSIVTFIENSAKPGFFSFL